MFPINQKIKKLIQSSLVLKGKNMGVYCFYMATDDSCIMIYLDDEDLMWKYKNCNQCPNSGEVSGDKDFTEFHISASFFPLIEEHLVTNWEEQDLQTHAVAEISLSSSRKIQFIFKYDTEEMQVRLL